MEELHRKMVEHGFGKKDFEGDQFVRLRTLKGRFDLLEGPGIPDPPGGLRASEQKFTHGWQRVGARDRQDQGPAGRRSLGGTALHPPCFLNNR